MASALVKICPVVLLVVTACSGVPKKKFEFDAIDADDNPRPCLVVINDDFPSAEQNNQFVNVGGDDVLELELEFASREINVTMAPVRVNNGKVTKVPRSARESWEAGFTDERRLVRIDDPKRVLFILQRKSTP